ncbi:Phosphatidylserine/phosphatidylglycerophosphate/cardiolipin synthase [Luteibacter sp. UNCMF331Sha3.1]|uniref:phospholipase D-like domain-containing protein n=1 Tax=Luteibacter sp. UNCMF331Sha3.1 TaxID=1502760 RepID=UPI0008C175E9|nr:phospholipase D-like domain-containing protein [Luteibacter sp. UNCMF331Sha3.1]SEN37472.1 Phosphatidylserine/phosphatidylglycerophosphate/cardiolipin synthase [Luteibacter sp. UNCMF331Sha3.1]
MNVRQRTTGFSSRLFAEQALSRSAGAPLIGGNAVELLIDARAHFDAWLAAIAGARRHVFLENYIIRDDAIGKAFLDALVERAKAGVFVAVIADWAGCLGQSRAAFWQPLRDAGGQVRIYNPPRLGSSFGWVSRDHRKVLVVDGEKGFLSGVCISEKWLGDPSRDVPPWRDTGVMLRGPAVAEIEHAFADSWRETGEPLPADDRISPPAVIEDAGSVSLRLIATQPSTAGMYRLDQMVAAMATRTLWLTDAYFVGVAPYVQALSAAARDGVDVRLLVPGTSDIPMVASMSRSGYRPLLKAGIRVFEWNGSMLHAKTAVADGRWARVGSSNLNIASWLSNREIDVAIEDVGFARQLEACYEADLENATEILLSGRRSRGGNDRMRSRSPRPPRPHRAGGSSSRAAAGALRIANTVGAAITQHRVLGDTESGPVVAGALAALVLTLVAIFWPAVIAWPLALIGAWFTVNLAVSWWTLRKRRRETREDADTTSPAR